MWFTPQRPYQIPTGAARGAGMRARARHADARRVTRPRRASRRRARSRPPKVDRASPRVAKGSLYTSAGVVLVERPHAPLRERMARHHEQRRRPAGASGPGRPTRAAPARRLAVSSTSGLMRCRTRTPNRRIGRNPLSPASPRRHDQFGEQPVNSAAESGMLARQTCAPKARTTHAVSHTGDMHAWSRQPPHRSAQSR